MVSKTFPYSESKFIYHFFTAFYTGFLWHVYWPKWLYEKIYIPDEFDGIENNSIEKYSKFLVWKPWVHNYYMIRKYIIAHQIYHYCIITTVCQPNQKVSIHDSAQIFLNFIHETHNLIGQSQIIILKPEIRIAAFLSLVLP